MKNPTEDIVINSIADFVSYTSKLYSEATNTSERLFFRGQANVDWDIMPSIFRSKSHLKRESEMIHEACRVVTTELDFEKHFELLTKLQHYGMVTRLLDVSLNPLVALFFACEKLLKKDGAVYFGKAIPFKHDSREIAETSKLAKVDYEYEIFSLGIKLSWVMPLSRFLEKPTFSETTYDEINKQLNNNQFVLPKHTSERLTRQSGAFLISSCFTVEKNDTDLAKSIVRKNATSLKSEFNEQRFVIPFNNKNKILKELDLYNVNKASLFPELEHKMDYIRSIIKRNIFVL